MIVQCATFLTLLMIVTLFNALQFANLQTHNCGGLKMAPHVNEWSPLGGAHA